MGQSDRSELRSRVDERFNELVRRFYKTVPYAEHFVSGDHLDPDYYRRHNIETILRIRRKRTVDAYAIRYFTHNDPAAASAWCKYCEEEMLHDHMFMRDLLKVGVTREQAYGQEPFLATKLMMGYLLYGMEYDGTPLALLVSVYLMEYITVLTQPKWLDNVARHIGEECVAGARSHVNLDIDDDHADFVWGVLVSLLKDEADEQRLFAHVDALYELWAMYFTELYESTVGARSAAQEPAARTAVTV